jgi:Spy/CpxP family protein refolding chaperone
MRITSAFLFAVFVIAGRPAAAQRPSRNWAADSAAFESLGLTADQRNKIKAIREQAQQQNAPLREQLQQALGGKSFRDLTHEERESLRPKIEPIRKQMMENRRKAHEQINAILTHEQREKLEQMHKHRGEQGEGEGEGPPS